MESMHRLLLSDRGSDGVNILRPRQLEPLRDEGTLKILEQSSFLANLSGKPLPGKCKADKRSRSLADIPLHRMEAGATVRNMCRANVFAGGDQVLYTDRK